MKQLIDLPVTPGWLSGPLKADKLEQAVNQISNVSLYDLIYCAKSKAYYLDSDSGGMIRNFETRLCTGTGQAIKNYFEKNKEYILSFSKP